ncbi:MAG: cell division protein SepF [Clostridia bacterium]|nr:cell division protein SepF [Clostridia bacterium]
MSGIFFKEEVEEEPVESGISAPQPAAMPNERVIWNERDAKRNEKKSNIVTVPNNNQSMEMVLIKANSYDDLQEIAANIKKRRVVVVNFEEMDQLTAQRMVDFLSGAVFALDGQPKKVSGGTFIFSSSSVDLSGQIVEADIAERTFPWSKQ